VISFSGRKRNAKSYNTIIKVVRARINTWNRRNRTGMSIPLNPFVKAAAILAPMIAIVLVKLQLFLEK